MSEAHYARIAGLYDAFVKTDYDVPFFLDEARKRGGDILELMAGTGRLTLPLLQAGFSVTCIDFSADMLRVLRDKLDAHNLTAEVHHLDVRDFDLGRRFKQIFLPFQAFPEITAEGDQRRALQRIHAHLSDDGVFICTLHNPAVRLKSVDGQMRLAARQALPDGGQLLVWLLQTHHAASNLVDVHEFFEEYDASGLLHAKRYSLLQFHLLEGAAFERLAAESGFDVLALYGDYAYAPFDAATSPFMIWLLR
ncbi:MAG: class I SAM-dependent methyltransferase, partial [Anaerolineae bacterium]|nr:class I SAM-dependent methyltransferase [Anaerolineae bacterium]